MRYWSLVFPRVGRELRRWETRAQAIPSPELRGRALYKLKTKRLSTEGGTLMGAARLRRRNAIVRFTVAYSTIVDYVDTLSEESAGDLRKSRQINRALIDSLESGAPVTDYFAYHDVNDDGGYLTELVKTCRDSVTSLPAYATVKPSLLRLGELACEAQSLEHASSMEDTSQIKTWADGQLSSYQDLRWWEFAAAASTPLLIFALVSLAEDPDVSTGDVEDLEPVYFPWICALNTLFDSLVDQGEDAASGQLNYVSQYSSHEETEERLELIASHALEGARSLIDPSLHEMVVNGLIGMYLSAPEVDREGFQELARRLVARTSPISKMIFWIFKARRKISRIRTATG